MVPLVCGSGVYVMLQPWRMKHDRRCCRWNIDLKDNIHLSWSSTQGSSYAILYDPSTGIYGMDFYVVLERPGYRVGRRRRCKSRVGIHQRVTKDDAMKWFQVKYEGVILNKSQNIGS
ncbi:hypothetical protein D5086_021494 [Populus alba]|uniref:Uncharacterized protein n=1 Tax=Populus alba TaxID=43335 RepID=A0ACC4BCV0_POPAL